MKDLEYGRAPKSAMRLDLYLPERGRKPFPLIIWIHGGAWMGGSKNGPSPALGFTAKGYAVAQVGYRLSREAIFPAQIHDCKAAVRWLRTNAGKYDLDMIMHGDRDRTVPFNQSELLYAALKKAGVDATFVPVTGAGHGFRGPEAIQPVEDFLARCLR